MGSEFPCKCSGVKLKRSCVKLKWPLLFLVGKMGTMHRTEHQQKLMFVKLWKSAKCYRQYYCYLLLLFVPVAALSLPYPRGVFPFPVQMYQCWERRISACGLGLLVLVGGQELLGCGLLCAETEAIAVPSHG